MAVPSHGQDDMTVYESVVVKTNLGTKALVYAVVLLSSHQVRVRESIIYLDHYLLQSYFYILK